MLLGRLSAMLSDLTELDADHGQTTFSPSIRLNVPPETLLL